MIYHYPPLRKILITRLPLQFNKIPTEMLRNEICTSHKLLLFQKSYRTAAANTIQIHCSVFFN